MNETTGPVGDDRPTAAKRYVGPVLPNCSTPWCALHLAHAFPCRPYKPGEAERRAAATAGGTQNG